MSKQIIKRIRNIVNRKKVIKEIAKKNGKSYSEIKHSVQVAKEKYGITLNEYKKYNLSKVNENKIEEEYKNQKKRERNRKAVKEYAVNAAIKEANFNIKEAIADVDDSKKIYRIRPSEYFLYKFYLVPECERKNFAEKIINEREIKKLVDRQKEIAKVERNNEYIQKIMNESGWTRSDALEKLRHARETNGVSTKLYYAYRFWELSEEEQATYFTNGIGRELSEKYSEEFVINRMMFYHKNFFLDKAEGFIGRKWLSTVNMNWEQFNKIFSEEKKIIYKPQADFGGEGVKVFNCDNKETLRKAYSEIEKLPFGVIESFVNQHPDMQQFSKKSVNTLRIVTIRTNNPEKGIETGKIHFIYGAMRMGSDDSYTDNLSSGGLMALIDIDTGILTTPGTDYSNRICYSHPITGAKIKGFHVPFFKEAKQIIIDFSEKYDIEGYYGWDIAITENGPILIEGNNAPGMELLQLPYVLEKKGMKHILDPYL